MKAWDFFDDVYEGHLSEFDMLNMVEDMTDHFDDLKLNLLCKEFDYYCIMKKEEWLGSFKDGEVQNAIYELERVGKKIPMQSDSKRPPLSVNHYFEHPKIKNLYKSDDELTDEQKRIRTQTIKELDEQYLNTIDVEKLIDPHNEVFFGLHRLKNILIELKRRHTDAVCKFDNKAEDSFNPFEIDFSSGISDTYNFFETVKSGVLSKIDIHNKVQELTSNYDQEKLKLLCEEFDEYIFVKYENWSSSFSETHFQKIISDYSSRGISFPKERDEKFKHHWLFVRDYFLRTRFGVPLSDEEFEKSLDDIFGSKRNESEVIDTNVLLGGFYYATGKRSLKNLRDILVELKRKYTDAVFRFGDKNPQINQILPIQWHKGEESLTKFIDDLKSNDFIEKKETKEIIQEHFEIDGQVPIKEPKPINWLKSKVLLAYLIEELSTKPEMHDPFMEPDKKWHLTNLHFVIKGKKNDRSLVHDLKQSRYPNGCEKIDTILKRLS